MRAFVAVFPPSDVRREALAWARRWSLHDRVRWSRPENVHLTLKFLGEVRAESLDDIRAALERVCTQHAPFNAALAELGAFPSARRGRTLWIGVGAGSVRRGGNQVSGRANRADGEQAHRQRCCLPKHRGLYAHGEARVQGLESDEGTDVHQDEEQY